MKQYSKHMDVYLSASKNSTGSPVLNNCKYSTGSDTPKQTRMAQLFGTLVTDLTASYQTA